jgi:hypothetical protein
MIPIIENNQRLATRLRSESRLSAAQRDALLTVALQDDAAGVLGLDAKMRPVVLARSSGAGRRTRWALMRNGDPTRVSGPLAEEWS